MSEISAAHYFKSWFTELATNYDQGEITAMVDWICRDFLFIKYHQLALIDKAIDNQQHDMFNQWLKRLQTGEPFQYIIGYTWFYGIKIEVNESVLIPRPETEELVDLVRKNIPDKLQVQIIDFGTGSGCIPITLKKHLPQVSVRAIDISENAIVLAQKNALVNHTNIQFSTSDILDDGMMQRLITDALEQSGQMIFVSNPPYIATQEANEMSPNVLKYEPHLALFSPGDPLLFYKQLAKIATFAGDRLEGVYCEINPLLANTTLECFNHLRLNNKVIVNDMQGKPRFVMINNKF
ncbi:MAG: peptide chain release factor N(5)-glutamine methyltransferase [Bacteroidia bacterium]|nr:peptide chain release factor N(5)-glutamine methyltransferase [Bacteroidia bacterium]